MSAVAARRVRRPRGRGFDLLAMLGIGVVIVAAALLPAVTANSGETTTVRGDVTVNGQPVPFFPVGFWTTSGGTVSRTTTDATGSFTFDVSATLDGYAYAGTAPDSLHTILERDGRAIVRGVISASPAGNAPSPMYQGRPLATARSLSGGAAEVHIKLQEAGRITGTSPVPASGVTALQVRRADNSVVQTLRLDSRGRFRSGLLAPGQYGVVLVPKAPGLPVVGNAIVPSGGTTTVTLSQPVTGATVSGTVRTSTGAVGAGVPVLLEQDDEVLATTRTSDKGAWSFTGVAAGEYAVEVGRFDEPATTGAAAIEVPIPGATSTPTPTASTASPSPAVTPDTPETAAIAPVERTADSVVPETFSVTVPDVLGDVGVATEVEAAGRIAGRVTDPDPAAGGTSAGVRVVVEETSGRIVRAATASSDGRYSVGGLEPGRSYRIYAVTEPEDPSLARMGEAVTVAGTTATTADVVITQPAVTLSGTVANGTSGRVQVGDAALLQRAATIAASSAYTVEGLVPGAYPVVVDAGTRTASQPVGVIVRSGQNAVDLQAGPNPAVFKGWFISSGAGVPEITGKADGPNGAAVRFGPRTNGGRVEIPGLVPGTYEYDADSFRGSAPAVDGPWFYLPPTGTFTLSDGATTDVQAIVLHVRAH
ncbi:carboxypeptidase-like regulatory domain-containing protein [Amnibacterium setariae]|uniref:alpha-amylase n=1 Tax=Amnibacterium setariae TaxID=2306585 RepID=A0A3A1TX04_9MICO|nr:carboxypeptidase-like regulatory domain-containing protein [Amnibacterium setariae]RIX28783.1 carboxypeptidase regulatory-like domain-containing protein [Amnibacterium setariae]